MKILSAPFYALFSKPFYREVSRSPLQKAFLYLLYLSLIMSTVFLGVMILYFFPQADRFMEWARKNMPALVLTQEGLSMKESSPYTMTHPNIGPLVTFDLTKDEIVPQQMGDVFIFVTRKNFYLRQPRDVKVYPISDAALKDPALRAGVPVTGETLEKFYRSVRPAVLVFSFFGVLLSFFIWKWIAALFYALIMGMIFNTMRSGRLGFGAVLNLTVFALTGSILFQILRLIVPFLGRIPFVFVLDISLAMVYLYFAVKMSEEPPSGPSILPPSA